MFNFPMARKDNEQGLLRVDSLFDDLLGFPVKFGWDSFASLPAVDVYEQGGNIVVKAELPGMKPEELHLAVEDDLLTISGEKKQENEVKEKDYYHLERTFGRFERRLRLPETVKAEGAKASYKDGILQVELPKSEQTKRKKINIEVK